MTLSVLLIPLAVAAITAGLAVLGHRQPPGKHQRTPRKLGRRQRHAIEEALHAAWQARVENHDAPPLLATQMQVAALTAAIPCWKPVPPAAGPVPTALAEVRDDPDYPHLASGQFGDWVTGQFAAVIEGEK